MNAIIVCPDCGQRFDPEKAARVRRVGSRARNATIKPAREHAQDVRHPAHARASVHHAMHVEQTRLIRDERRCYEFSGRILPLEEIESDAVDLEFSEQRHAARSISDAARMVERTSSPWWVCWLTICGWPQDKIAGGIGPTRNLFSGYSGGLVEPFTYGDFARRAPLFDKYGTR